MKLVRHKGTAPGPQAAGQAAHRAAVPAAAQEMHLPANGRTAHRAALAAACLLALLALAMPAAVPAQAHADEAGVCAYAYLYPSAEDPGEYDLVLQATEKPETDEGFILAGKVGAGDAYSAGDGEYALDEPAAASLPPWYELYAGRIVSAQVVEADGAKVAPTSMAFWFAYLEKLRSVDLSGLDASKLEDMSYLFFGCGQLESVDLAGLDASSVESMRGMFQSCAKLERISLPDSKTENLATADSMFASCETLSSLSLGGLDLSRVGDLSYLFYGCKALGTVDATAIDTSSATSLKAMFAWCESLDYLNASKMDTSKVTSMEQLFAHCGNLSWVDLSGSFTMGAVSDAGSMFQACGSLQKISLGKGFAASAQTVQEIAAADGLASVLSSEKPWALYAASDETDESQEFTSLPDLIDYAATHATAEAALSFASKASLAESGASGQGEAAAIYARLRGGDTLVIGPDAPAASPESDGVPLGRVPASGALPWAAQRGSITKIVFEGEIAPIATTNWFRGMEKLASIEGIAKLDTSHTTHMANMFLDCSSLEEIDLSGFDTSQVTSMFGMFYGCSSLKRADLSGFDFSNVSTVGYFFYDCASLEEAKLPAAGTSASPSPHLADMEAMFAGCASLATADLSGLGTSQVASTRDLFARCESLTQFDANSLSWESVTDASGMFAGCASLSGFDFTGVRAPHLTTVDSIFADCRNLASVSFGDADLSAIASAKDAFARCTALDAVRVGAGARLAQGAFPDGMWTEDATPGEILRSTEMEFNGSQAAQSFSRIAAHATAFAVLAEDGTLTISMTKRAGAGEREYLPDPTGYDAPEGLPWHADRGRISKLVVESSGPVSSIAFWFSGCDKLAEANMRGMETAQLADMRDAFAGCTELGDIDLSAWGALPAVDLSGLFDGCSSLERVALPSGLAPTKLARMFRFCAKLSQVVPAGSSASGALLDMRTLGVEDFSEMFRGCSALASLDLASFDTRSATDMRRMLHGCRALESIRIGSRFTFRGASTARLPGSEFPSGAWQPGGAGGTAYFSDSVPSFPLSATTYVKLAESDADDPGITIISIAGENADGEPALTVESTIGEDGGEELAYDVNDETYASDTLVVGDSPRAASFNSTVIGGSSITSKTRKVKEVKSNGRITHVVVGSGVSKIGAKAFKGTKVTLLTVKSGKLTKKSSMKNCLTGSNVSTVLVSVPASKKQKVKDAFTKWSGKKVNAA